MKKEKIIICCVAGMIATLTIGIVVGSSFSKEIHFITTEYETETIVKTETEYPEAIYAVVETDNDTYYYDAFRWDKDHHIYIRLNNSWESSFETWWANNRGSTMYGIRNKSSFDVNQTWRNPFNETVWIDEPYIWTYCIMAEYPEHIYFGDPNGNHWINLHKNPDGVV